MRLRPCWYHGKSVTDGLWQMDRAHPGVWLASTRVAASWYAGKDGVIVKAELRTRDVLDLCDADTFNMLVHRAGLGQRLPQVRRAHTRGNLYLLEEGAIQNALVTAAFRTHVGVIMRDRTDRHSHLTLVVQGPEALLAQSEAQIDAALHDRAGKSRARQT